MYKINCLLLSDLSQDIFETEKLPESSTLANNSTAVQTSNTKDPDIIKSTLNFSKF